MAANTNPKPNKPRTRKWCIRVQAETDRRAREEGTGLGRLADTAIAEYLGRIDERNKLRQEWEATGCHVE